MFRFLPKYISEVTLKILHFHYLNKKIWIEVSIKLVYLILKTEALVGTVLYTITFTQSNYPEIVYVVSTKSSLLSCYWRLQQV